MVYNLLISRKQLVTNPKTSWTVKIAMVEDNTMTAALVRPTVAETLCLDWHPCNIGDWPFPGSGAKTKSMNIDRSKPESEGTIIVYLDDV